jgi:hypothetical protein
VSRADSTRLRKGQTRARITKSAVEAIAADPRNTVPDSISRDLKERVLDGLLETELDKTLCASTEGVFVAVSYTFYSGVHKG